VNHKSDSTLMHEWQNQTSAELDTFSKSETYFRDGLGSTISKLENFPKYVRRQTLSKFLARAEIYRKIVGIHGSVVDCGVNAGCSLMTFAQLSAVWEPVNYTRKVIGFDTFEGLTGVSDKDMSENTSSHVREGGFAAPGYFEDIQKATELYDGNRMLGHIPKVELVKGDIRKTLPSYLEANRHLVVSLLHLDMDIYEPTKIALELLRPRMPKGAVIIFDELNQKGYPGETQAVFDSVGISNLKIERMSYETGISFAVLN
jgi:hypothetical protein